ncbi:MAG: hypothetical protein ACP5KA_07575, partial [Desulfurococcaceae archaeon]
SRAEASVLAASLGAKECPSDVALNDLFDRAMINLAFTFSVPAYIDQDKCEVALTVGKNAMQELLGFGQAGMLDDKLVREMGFRFLEALLRGLLMFRREVEGVFGNYICISGKFKDVLEALLKLKPKSEAPNLCLRILKIGARKDCIDVLLTYREPDVLERVDEVSVKVSIKKGALDATLYPYVSFNKWYRGEPCSSRASSSGLLGCAQFVPPFIVLGGFCFSDSKSSYCEEAEKSLMESYSESRLRNVDAEHVVKAISGLGCEELAKYVGSLVEAAKKATAGSLSIKAQVDPQNPYIFLELVAEDFTIRLRAKGKWQAETPALRGAQYQPYTNIIEELVKKKKVFHIAKSEAGALAT